jgi:enolase
MSKITSIRGREIIDSRGNPTVEADVELASGALGRAAVPSGASTGSREAVELRDGDRKRFLGKGVLRAVANVNGEIRNALTGQDAADQAGVDARLRALDGTDNKSRLGANALLAVSLATAQATARDRGMPLFRSLGDGPYTMPVPMMNIINGGAHADNNVDIQEFMILPVGAASFSEALRHGTEMFHALKAVLGRPRLARRWATRAASRRPAVQRSGARCHRRGRSTRRAYRGGDIFSAWTCASSEFYEQGSYHLEGEGRSFNPAAVRRLSGRPGSRRYPIITIEDGMAEGDWDGWAALTGNSGARCSWWGMTCSSPTPRSSRGHQPQDRQCDPHQAEPDRHADRDPGGRLPWRSRPATRRWCRTARVRPRTPPSPISPWLRQPRRSRPDRSAVPTAWRSTISCCGSRNCWGSMAIRVATGVLALLFCVLQFRLWVSNDGFGEAARLAELIEQQNEENSRLSQRNQRLEAEVVDLRSSEGAVEERARADLGLIGPGETFYIFSAPRPAG